MKREWHPRQFLLGIEVWVIKSWRVEVMELIFLLEWQQFLSVNVLETLGDILVHVPHSPALLLRHPGKHLSVTERSEMMVICYELITCSSTGCIKSTHDENPLKICLHKLQMHITQIHRPAKPESCSLHNICANRNTSFSYQDLSFNTVHSHKFFLEKTFINNYSSVDTDKSDYSKQITTTNTKTANSFTIISSWNIYFPFPFSQICDLLWGDDGNVVCLAPLLTPCHCHWWGEDTCNRFWSAFWLPWAWLTLPPCPALPSVHSTLGVRTDCTALH